MNKITKISETLGKLKVWQSRLSGYISMINFFMIFYLYIIESPMGLLWYHWALLIIVMVISIVFVDTKFIMPQSFGYTFSKNPGYQEMKKDLKEIKKMLQEKT